MPIQNRHSRSQVKADKVHRELNRDSPLPVPLLLSLMAKDQLSTSTSSSSGLVCLMAPACGAARRGTTRGTVWSS